MTQKERYGITPWGAADKLKPIARGVGWREAGRGSRLAESARLSLGPFGAWVVSVGLVQRRAVDKGLPLTLSGRCVCVQRDTSFDSTPWTPTRGVGAGIAQWLEHRTRD